MTQITSPIRKPNVVKVRSGGLDVVMRSPSSSSSSSREQFRCCAFFGAVVLVVTFAIVTAAAGHGDGSGVGYGGERSLSSCEYRGTSTPNVELMAMIPSTVREYATTHEHQHRTLQHHFANYITGGHTLHNYNFLAYLAETYGDCRPLLQVGDANAAITLALSSSSSNTARVKVYDPTTTIYGRSVPGLRGRRAKWMRQLLAHQLDVTFMADDLNQADADVFRQHVLTSWLIVLSGSVPQRTFLQRLIDDSSTTPGGTAFSGLVVIDQIHAKGDMQTWWSNLVAQQWQAPEDGGDHHDSAQHRPYRAYDVTSIADHPMGLLDFSRRVHVLVGSGGGDASGGADGSSSSSNGSGGGDEQKQVAIVAL
jgi:hypothetical protein